MKFNEIFKDEEGLSSVFNILDHPNKCETTSKNDIAKLSYRAGNHARKSHEHSIIHPFTLKTQTRVLASTEVSRNKQPKIA